MAKIDIYNQKGEKVDGVDFAESVFDIEPNIHVMHEVCRSLPNLRVCGLMTMAPQGDLAAAREAFRGLKALRDELRRVDPQVAQELFPDKK